ncbi:NEL-type E3 ubiquitin ligase domain-containing protein [Pseudomonas sp. NPDC087697]|uniref:NEL-type E3 ubiquitin ligase domain-containing protein n=1 Tax=Pseudomonas sp. NPDC087697 TaxID=3364447 RepID=UPI0037F47356
MSELNRLEVVAGRTITLPEDKGVHYERVVQALPTAIKEVLSARLSLLVGSSVTTLPDWYLKASESQQRYLKELIEDRWRLQGHVDGPLENLQQDIKAFAKRLFSSLIKSNFNTDEDVSTLTLKLYVRDTIIFGIDRGASRLRESTLLDAALHNFEEPETAADYFASGSGVYRTDVRGELGLIPAMTVSKIATLCRQLDVGAQYQTHIKSILLPADPSARLALEQAAVASEKAAFKLDALIAYLKEDISSYTYGKLRDVRDNKRDIVFHDRPLHWHRLSLMGFRLHGIVLFSALSEPSKIEEAVNELTPDTLKFWLDWSQRVPALSGDLYERFKLLQSFFANGPSGVSEEMLRRDDIYQQSHLSGPVIAYVPEDPLHPLKEYDSLADFMKELISQLRQSDYQEFFSRFVAQKDKGRFFARVNERLTQITWQQREPLDMGPWWRESAVENPNAEPITNLMEGDLWQSLYRDKRDKAISDARAIAVPTGDENATTRWKRLTSYLDIGWNIFNFGAMLVPGLGEAMLGLMVAQMAAELLEGIEDWSKGDKEEASAHLTGVMINFAQLALMGAGHVLPGGAALAVKPSPLIDSLKPVELANGKTRLWKSDLGPYEHPVTLPADTKANRLGLYQHNNQQWLRLEDKHYQVRQDPVTGQHRLQHPQRPTAYQPRVEHNGAGAWKTEIEQPMTWDANRVTRRLGHSLDKASDATLAKFRRVSGVDENLLRRLHVEHETPPALVMDAVTRFDAYADAERLPEHILDNRVPEEMIGYLPATMVEVPRWPESRALEVFDGDDYAGASFKHGNVMAAEPMTLKITRAELVAGKLPERVIESLSPSEIREMLGEQVGSDTPSRVDALRSRLAMQARKQKKRLFESLYKTRDVSTNPNVHLLKTDYSELPSNVAQELLDNAEPGDLQHLAEKKRIPLRLRQQARRLQARVQLNRAYEGLYFEELATADTRRLELGTLAALPGWSADVRMEIRLFGFEGDLQASVGPVNAPIRKVLVLDEEGRFNARDADNQDLHGADDLYASVLHALPDTERNALGYNIYEGARLKDAVLRSPLSHDQLEPILLENPVRKPFHDPTTAKLLGGMDGYRYAPGEPNARYRARSLYPNFTETELDELVQRFSQSGLSFGVQIDALELEFDQLCRSLTRWVNSPTQDFRFGLSGVGEWNARNQLAKKIRQCWQRSGPRHLDGYGKVIGQALDLTDFPLNLHFAGMPTLEANFDHVTHLRLRNTGLSNAEQAFLQPFRKARALDLAHNRMTRLPPIIAEMPNLNYLDLERNGLVLRPADVELLKNRTLMQSLNLSRNPLGLLPDISRMRGLLTLILNETGVSTWPPGLFAVLRPRHIYLDLQRNVLTQIPLVQPGLSSAELLARTLLSREPQWMSAENLELLKEYIRSVGMDPDRPYPPRGPRDSIEWEEGLTRDQWAAKQNTWYAVEDELNSFAFFNELRVLTQSADFKATTAYRADLTAKVWRMLDAMAENAELRTRFFAEAVARTRCVDGATQLFNLLGVEVLVHEAYELGNVGLIEAELVELAKGKTRLDELERIARGHISAREATGEEFLHVDAAGDLTGSIDEVEVHLAFMTDLAQRLDLPWQARGMQFRQIAGVTSEMIEEAYQRILKLEEGDLLRDAIAEQPFWQFYVERYNRVRLRALDREVEAITEFKDVLEDRTDVAQLTLAQRERLKEQVKVLAAELGKSESDFVPGQVMTDEAYAVELARIKIERDTLLKQLTQEAMDRAKLQRVEIPFTVEANR